MIKVPVALEKSFLRTRLNTTRQALSGRYTGLILTLKGSKSRVEVYSAETYLPGGAESNINAHLDTLKDINSQSAAIKITRPKWKSRLLNGSFAFFISASVLILLILFIPVAYYQLFPADPIPVKAAESGTPLGGQFAEGTHTPTRQVVQPAYDETLPEGNWVIIPRIGVRTEILESEKSEDSLNKGVWRVPEFGKPGDLSKPMILAAHRYGYVSWWKGSQYWRYHSFYLLPDLEPGDLVIVISDKRKYLYEIYSGEEGEEISDYNADLILYTCKFLNSPVRHFRYARLLDANASTQTQQPAASPN